MTKAEITDILPQEGKKNRLVVCLDKLPWLSLHKDTLKSLKLNVGLVQDFEKLKRKILIIERQRAIDQISKFLRLRPRSQAEIKGRLEKYGYQGEVVDQVMKSMVGSGLVDDWQFAKWWVNEGIYRAKKGRKRLKSELLMRGVEKEIIESTLQEIYREGDDFERARELVRRKYYITSKVQESKAKEKILGFLTRRGFTNNIALEVWKSLKNDR